MFSRNSQSRTNSILFFCIGLQAGSAYNVLAERKCAKHASKQTLPWLLVLPLCMNGKFPPILTQNN